MVFLTDVDGLYENFENKDSLISNLTLFEAQYMVENNIVSTGMIPKLKSCIHALDSGVFRAHIINGITPHSLLLELLTSTGVGTTMHSTEESCTFDPSFGQLRLQVAGESPACCQRDAEQQDFLSERKKDDHGLYRGTAA